MPRSVLLGRQRRSVTVYHYDDKTGRLAWSETGIDAEWLGDDLDWAMAWQEEQDSLCPGCAQPLEESTDESLKDQWVAHEVTCYSCMAKARVDRSPQPGRRFWVRRKVRPDR